MFFRSDAPDHPIFADPLFKSEEYREFSERVKAACSAAEDPHVEAVAKVIPSVAAGLRNLATGQTSLEDKLTSLQGEVGRLTACIQEQARTEYVLARVPRDASRHAPVALQECVNLPAADILSESPAGTLPLPLHTVIEASTSVPFMYQLSRTVSTIPELYKEWTEGLGGLPSVEELDEQHGSRWRPSGKERQFYCRRKKIIDEAKRRADAGGVNIKVVVEQMEEERLRDGASLNAVAKLCKAS